MKEDHTNSNGLVDGNIPAGQACPFVDNCTMKKDICPTKEKVNENPISCGAARIHSLYTLKEKREKKG